MATAGELIDGALRLIGQLAEGETPSPETSRDALIAMNEMLESWSIERLSIYSTQDQVFTWPASQVSRTLGPSGDFVGERPILLEEATYFRDPATGISYNIEMINQEQYDAIALKTVTSTYPQLLFVNMEMPNIRMYVYPVPTVPVEFHFVSAEPLTQAATRGTEMVFPPGYRRAFRYNLACELAGEFGVAPSADVKRIASISKRNLKRINNPLDLMNMPFALVAKRARYNIYSGNF